MTTNSLLLNFEDLFSNCINICHRKQMHIAYFICTYSYGYRPRFPSVITQKLSHIKRKKKKQTQPSANIARRFPFRSIFSHVREPNRQRSRMMSNQLRDKLLQLCLSPKVHPPFGGRGVRGGMFTH